MAVRVTNSNLREMSIEAAERHTERRTLVDVPLR
jgi:hypothetical protein